MPLTKAELLQTKSEPAWTGNVKGVGEISVREINGDDFEFIKNSLGNTPDQKHLAARIVVAGLCDENGKPVFERGEVADVCLMPFGRLKALAEAVQNHCGMTDDDTAELGNSQTTTPNEPGTD